MSKKVGRVEMFDISITFLSAPVGTRYLIVNSDRVGRSWIGVILFRRVHEISGEHYGQRECSQKAETKHRDISRHYGSQTPIGALVLI